MTYEGFCEKEGGRLPFAEDLSVFREKTAVGRKTAQNRIVYHPMEGCDGTADGAPGEYTIRRYRRFAQGGPGIIWFEAVSCMEQARANPRQLYLTEKNLDAFSRLVEMMKQVCMEENGYEPLVILQDTHSGRYSKPDGTPRPIIVRNNPYLEKDGKVDPARIITDEELDQVKEALVHTAFLAEKAGFDGVDIKCNHCYLNSELLGGYDRPGRYGGSFENRTRLLREAVQGAVQQKGKDFFVASRVNLYDGFPYPYGFGADKKGGDGIDEAEGRALLAMLEQQGVVLANLAMGNPYVNPHVNRPYRHGGYTPPESPMTGLKRLLEGCAQIASGVERLATVCTGLSYLGEFGPGVAAALLKEGKYTFAGFGRMTFAYPDLARDLLQNGGLKRQKCCVACGKCTELMRGGTVSGCVVRDSEVYVPIYKSIQKKGE